MSINSNNFLEQFENQGFYFSKEMIFNFHNCLITKPFVILSGISGSGKSKLGELYADIISEFAIPVLDKNGIKYEYNNKVDFIQNNDKTGMCPMENKFKDENDLNVIYNFCVK